MFSRRSLSMLPLLLPLLCCADSGDPLVPTVGGSGWGSEPPVQPPSEVSPGHVDRVNVTYGLDSPNLPPVQSVADRYGEQAQICASRARSAADRATRAQKEAGDLAMAAQLFTNAQIFARAAASEQPASESDVSLRDTLAAGAASDAATADKILQSYPAEIPPV